MQNFEDATGIQIVYTASPGNDDMLAKVNADPTMFDLVALSDVYVGMMNTQKLLFPIDPARIPNYPNIDPTYQGQYYDPDNQYSIPYTSYVPLIVYNPDMVSFDVTGYADLWNSEFNNKLSCVGDSRTIIGMAQKKLGFSFNETDPDKMAQVGDELMKLKPNIMSLNDDTPHNALISGDASAGIMFGSQIEAARAALPNLKVVYPKEGLAFGIDCLVVPSGAKHVDATYIFLNYLLDGRVSAYTSMLINYTNCNLAAPPFLSDEFKNNDTVNIPKDIMKTAEMMKPLPADAQTLYNNIWVNFMQ